MAAPKKSAPKAANADGSLTDNPVKGGVTLDRSKKFYDVHSGGNVKFEQDGKLFNLEGNQVDLDGNLFEVKVAGKTPEPAVETVVETETVEPAVEAEKTEGMTEDDLAALGGK